MSGALSSLYGGRGIELSHGCGSRVFDTGGKEYLDFFNGHGAELFGHAVPELVAALKDAADKMWSGGAGFESQARAQLAEMLGSLLGDGRVFLANSGTEAIEAALKLSVVLRPGRKRVLACRRGFHGRTCGALGMTFNPKYRKPFAGFIPNVEHFEPAELAANIDEDTVAVFVEPVQGEGGVYPLDPDTGRVISSACVAKGALLVADEVQTGLGRCGAPLASPLAGLTPDIVCIAKGLAGGLPAGAAIWKKELGDFPPHSHGSTYGGNELVARVAIAAVGMMLDRKLYERAAKLGRLFRSELAKIDSPVIKDIRGLGLLNGVELTVPSLDVIKALQEKGVLSLAAGPRVVRFLPSFAAAREDMIKVAEIFGQTLKEFSR
jgi:acetylornithine/succinyldiaminopimelate/putrescine aminotransferase